MTTAGQGCALRTRRCGDAGLVKRRGLVPRSILRDPWATASVEFGQGLGWPWSQVSAPIPKFLGLWILLKGLMTQALS